MARFSDPEELFDSRNHIQTIDMHTGGEPLRVILSGIPEIKGSTVLEKRSYMKSHFDHFRKLLMLEPRGHADMYGLIKVDAERDDSDFGVLFMHNEGYSTMCGHATIAITKLAVDFGWVNSNEGINEIRIDAPCGQIKAFARVENNKVKNTWFEGVPSFVIALDEVLVLPEYGEINYDLAYGGAFYAYVNSGQFDLDLTPENYQQIRTLGMMVKKEIIRTKYNVIHPFEKDLSYIYGTILIGEPVSDGVTSRNVCVFADGEVDRSPTGSGVSGRMAIHALKNELPEGKPMIIESILGTKFTCSYRWTSDFGPHKAVIPEVHGEAFYTGVHSFFHEEADSTGSGFLLR